MHIHVQTHIYMHIYYIAHICIHVHVCVFMCICAYVHIHICNIHVDWGYLLHGFIFGFQVINRNCKTTYSGRQPLKMDASKQQFITGKLQSELELSYITHVKDIPQCVHNVFCIDKASSHRVVVDCSKLYNTTWSPFLMV